MPKVPTAKPKPVKAIKPPKKAGPVKKALTERDQLYEGYKKLTKKKGK